MLLKNRIEILSFPGPVPPVNAKILAENKRIVARDYRNRRVGDFLKELHLTEGRSTGFPTIYKALEDNGSPPPIMETDEQCTYFLSVLHINGDFTSIVESDQESDQVTDKEKKILSYCIDSRSRAEILSEIGISNHTTNYKRHIEPLLEKELLQMTIPDSPKNRNQKYRTTQKGKEKLRLR